MLRFAGSGEERAGPLRGLAAKGGGERKAQKGP